MLNENENIMEPTAIECQLGKKAINNQEVSEREVQIKIHSYSHTTRNT